MNLSPGAYTLYAVTTSEAVFLRSTVLEPEHFFLGLLKIEDILGQKVFPEDLNEDQKQGAMREIAELAEFWKKRQVSAKELRRRLRFLLTSEQKETGEFSGHRSQRGRELFELAEKISEEQSKSQIELMPILQACLKVESTTLKALFTEFKIDPQNWVSVAAATPEQAEAAQAESKPESEEHPLAKFGRDLTALAKAGKMGPIIGRSEEIKDIARILTQRTRNNPILLGDPGVGKTAVVEGLVLYAVQKDALAPICDMHFVEITMSALVSGTKYRGEFEEKIQKVLDGAKQDPNLVLFIDEIHTMMGAGSGEGTTLDAANILKPALARGDMHCIGATTTAEYRKHIEPDGALARRFQQVWIDEPSPDETLQILHGLRPKLQKHHNLKISDEVLEKAAALSSRYLTDGYQPDKAIMTLDEACARRRLMTLSAKSKKVQTSTIEEQDVAEVIARRSQIPVEVILQRDEERLLALEQELGKRVIGQENAVSSVSRAIRIARAGLKAKNRPVVLLFAGPTGTGKTELAKVLSKYLYLDEKRLITLDMSEFQESHAVAKIVGSPPGYIGFGEESPFIREIRQHPSSVVLLDEIEKAHANIMMIFLQIFDEGRLTDSRGKEISCSEAIFILTSNLGAEIKIKKPQLGFRVEQAEEVEMQQEAVQYEKQVRAVITASLRPELLNRLQEVIVFQPLSRKAIHQILDLYIKSINDRLSERQICVVLEDSAKDLLADAGYSNQFGARYLQRAVDRTIAEPLSREILAGNLKAGDTALFRKDGDKLALDIQSKQGTKTFFYPTGDGDNKTL